MGRVIQGTTGFAPTVRLENEGDFVKGKVISKGELPKDKYGHIAPKLNLELIDLEGKTETGSSKERTSVDVAVGDTVGFIGNGTDLRDKLPQVNIGDIVTITFKGEVPSGKGMPKKTYTVVVED